MSGEHFLLIWNSFPRNLSSGLYTLLTDEQLVDVTLAAEGKILRAHKLILSVCSTYFNKLFKENSCKHPIVILKDINYDDLSAMLRFMYQGEVSIKQEDVASFLKVAEILQIKGLTAERKEKEDLIFGNNVENVDHYSDVETNSENHLPSVNGIYGCENLIDSLKETASNASYTSQRTLLIEKCKNIDAPIRKEHMEKTQYESLSNTGNMDVNAVYKSHVLNNVFCNTEDNLHKSGPSGMASEDHRNHADNADKPVKDKANHTLSLETTLRLVSEISPTFCMEKGKLIRTYSCPWCFRNFTRKENLKLHVRYIHGPLENLTCKLCGNKYKNSNSLRVHSYLYHNVKRDKHDKLLVTNST